MRDVMDFCINILTHTINCLFSLNLGGYTFGDFLTVTVVISIFVSSLVISFRSMGSNPAREIRSHSSGRRSGGRSK